MIEKALKTIERYNMLPSGCHVVVGLSGGADSVALTHFLATAFSGFTLSAAHLNHGLRGPEADRDEAFARAFCKQLNIPLAVERVDAQAERQKGEGVEACGRRLRYEFFAKVLSPSQSGRIATAHTQNDQAETVLLNLARGAGLKGLCGIPPVRGNIIRPLLQVTREDILAYCAEHHLDYITDSTNAEIHYARNRVRHLVIPGLLTVNPAFTAAAARLASSLSEDEAYLSATAEETAKNMKTVHPLFGDTYPVKALSELPGPIRTRLLAAAFFKQSGLVLEAVHIDALLGLLAVGGQVSLPGGNMAAVSGGVFYFHQNFILQNREIFGKLVEYSEFQEWNVKKLKTVHENFLIAAVDRDKIVGEPTIRTRLPGDRLQLPKRPDKLLRKLFNEKSIPPALRDTAVVLADDRGAVAAEFIGVAERAAADNHTKNILSIWEKI